MKVKINIDGHFYNEVELPASSFSYKTRMNRSMKLFFILLLGAVGAILIPILHYILVPGLLISAFIFPILKFKEIALIDLMGFKCPSCNNPFKEKFFPLKSNDSQKRVYCFECRKNISFILQDKI